MQFASYISIYIYSCLARILSESEDPIKLAIACHDVGQYIERVPLGKKYWLIIFIITDH